MFFFLPYGTDAPLYYWPFATGALILANILVFVLQNTLPPSDRFEFDDTEQIEFDLDGELEFEDAADETDKFLATRGSWSRNSFALSHGDGLHPVQWVTSMFMHAGLGHLFANMIFLWTFGLVLEGRLGPWRFPLLYVGLGVTQSALEQILYLGYESEPSLGASSAIYGLMLICLLWTPQDNLIGVFFAWVFFRVFFFQAYIPLAIIAAVYFMLDLGVAISTGFELSTPLLHLMGALVGIAVGYSALHFQWVHCEDRDMISLLRETITGNPRPKNVKPRKKSKDELKQEADAEQARLDKIQLIHRSIDQHIAAGRAQAAMKLYRDLKKIDPGAQIQQNTLLKLINLLQSEKRWDDVIVYCQKYIEQYEPMRDVVRLNLARIFVTQKLSPKKALKIVSEIDHSRFDAKQRKLMAQIIHTAKRMVADGFLEVSDE